MAVMAVCGRLIAVASEADVVTDLAGLRLVDNGVGKDFRDVRIEAMVCSVSASGREMVLSDKSGAEVLRVDAAAQVKPGDHILLAGAQCRVRRERWGVSLQAKPFLDNDGLHGPVEKSGKIFLESGVVPLRLGWFNASLGCALNLEWRPPGGAREKLPAAMLLRRNNHGVLTNGVNWRCYEGSWGALPDFDGLPAAASGSAPDIGLDVETRTNFVGLVFDGFLDVSRGGEYEFFLRSDDGGQLFIGETPLKISVVSSDAPPPPMALKPSTAGAESRWAESSGTVQQMIQHDDGLEIFLNSADGPLRVRLAGRASPPVLAPEARVLVRGVAREAFRPDGVKGFGILNVAAPDDIRVDPVKPADGTNELTTAAQVARLSRAEAARAYPVKIRGVITCDAPEIYYGSVIHDQTRGIYCYWSETNSTTGLTWRHPHFGEFWEIEGVCQEGRFAPDVQVRKMTFRGEGELPAPVSPAWDQLLNGSLDTQFAELQGIITDADTNGVVLLTHGGKIRINLTPPLGVQLQAKKNALVRLRGCLLAVWDAESHQVKLGEIRLGNATAAFDPLQPADPFDAPQKSAGELLRFDVSAGSLQRVKMSGQIMEKRGEEIFMLSGQRGVRFVPRERSNVQPGELVEVAGFPELDGPSPVLHEAAVRHLGFGSLPDPVWLKPDELFRPQNDAQYVRLEATYNGARAAAGETLLDLQAGGNFFSARLRARLVALPKIEPGSRVEVTGLFAALSAPHRLPGRHFGSFEILLSSPASVRVIATPPWWTLPRLLAVTGALFAILILAALWITQLRRRVEERTEQLRHEISERERAEQLRVVQEERTRIAQDLHDDLGSSLTEIGVLASAGRRGPEAAALSHDVFEAISEKSRRLVIALDAIVWAIDPKENTLQSLADYLAGYVEDYLSTNGITCRFKMSAELPPAVMEGKVRHELFLVVKEALHNIVRHAHATEVEFHLTVAEAGIEITMRDNGCGFDTAAKSSGHGLKNFSNRMSRLGGKCEVSSHIGDGTTVIINLPLPATKELQPTRTLESAE
jgi:signal transduction histidine kinase